MSLIENLPTNYNLLSPVSFRFDIIRLPNVTFFTQGVNLPGISIEESFQTTPFTDIPQPGTKVVFESLELNFLVDEDLANYTEVMNWIVGMGFPEEFGQYKDLTNSTDEKVGLSSKIMPQENITSDATLSILTNSKNVNKQVFFRGVFPTSLSAITFDSAGENASILATASFQIRDYIIETV